MGLLWGPTWLLANEKAGASNGSNPGFQEIRIGQKLFAEIEGGHFFRWGNGDLQRGLVVGAILLG